MTIISLYCMYSDKWWWRFFSIFCF